VLFRSAYQPKDEFSVANTAIKSSLRNTAELRVGTEYRILDLLVPKRLDTIAWTQRQWFDWNGLPICTVSREGLIEMKLAAGRDIDRFDIKQLGFAEDE
jgi:hypothetical protein